jgi:hypothetical protein
MTCPLPGAGLNDLVAEALVRPLGVVMLRVLFDHVLQVMLPKDWHPIQALAFYASDELVNDTTQMGRHGQYPDGLDPECLQDLAEHRLWRDQAFSFPGNHEEGVPA